MIGEKACFNILKSAIRYAQSKKPHYIEFLLLGWERCLTRVANSQIHQNVAETEGSLSVEVMHDLRTGSASTNLLTKDSVHRAIDIALEAAKQGTQLESELIIRESSQGEKRGKFSERTAGFTPQNRAKVLKGIIDMAGESSLITSAKFQTGAGEIAMANSRGTMAYTSFTDANLSVILTGVHDSTYGAIASHDAGELDTEQLVEGMIRKARLQNTEPQDLFAGKKPGDEIFYDVILEPYATATWLEFLSSTGFNGLRYQEQESFLFGKLGQKVLGENATIWDDGTDPAGYLFPFDFEGTPKRKVHFVEKGVGRNVAYDGLLAAKEGKESTGHSLGAGSRHLGALPLNLFMEGGEDSIEAMIDSSSDPTIYVTRFHYTNVADRRKVVLTGMTKDGTFLVKNGEILAPLINLRYLQGVVESFNNIRMLSKASLVHDPAGYGPLLPSCTVVPALKIKKVRFIGSTGRP